MVPVLSSFDPSLIFHFLIFRRIFVALTGPPALRRPSALTGTPIWYSDSRRCSTEEYDVQYYLGEEYEVFREEECNEKVCNSPIASRVIITEGMVKDHKEGQFESRRNV